MQQVTYFCNQIFFPSFKKKKKKTQKTELNLYKLEFNFQILHHKGQYIPIFLHFLFLPLIKKETGLNKIQMHRFYCSDKLKNSISAILDIAILYSKT